MFYWIIVNNSSGAIGTGFSTHPPDKSLAPTGFTFLGPYDGAKNKMDSATQVAYDNPQAWLYQNGKFVPNPNYNAAAIALAKAQQNQLAAIDVGYNATLEAGFTSKATGSTVTYGWKLQDQLDLQLVQSAITQGIDKFPIEYGALDGSIVSITDQTMLTQLQTDANAFAWAQKKQKRTLENQVKAQTSAPSTPVIWAPATY